MSEALKMSVMWYGVALLPRLRALPRAQLQLAAQQASDLSGTYPLHMQPCASQKFILAALNPAKEWSGVQVIAVMVFSLFVLVDERPEMCSGLMEAWPIREALALAPRAVPAKAI